MIDVGKESGLQYIDELFTSEQCWLCSFGLTMLIVISMFCEQVMQSL